MYMCVTSEYVLLEAYKNLTCLEWGKRLKEGYVLTLEGLVRHNLYCAPESIDPGKHT